MCFETSLLPSDQANNHTWVVILIFLKRLCANMFQMIREHLGMPSLHKQSIWKFPGKRFDVTPPGRWILQKLWEKQIPYSGEISLTKLTSSLSILLSSTLLSDVGWQYESSMWIASIIQSCSSLIPSENWLCSATIRSSLDTFSWKQQTWFSRDFAARSHSNCKTVWCK